MKTIICKIGRIIKFHKVSMCIIVSISLFCMAESFFHPIVVQRLTDDGLLKKDYHTILFYGSLLILLIIIIQIFEVLQTWLLLKVRNDVLHKLHLQAFEKMLHLKMSYFTEKNSAEIMNQLNVDIESAGILLDKGFIYMFTYTLRIFSGFIGLFYINWKMALCILACIPVKLVLLHIFSDKKEKTYTEYINKSQKFYAWMSDRITGIRELKLLDRYEKEEERNSAERAELLKINRKINMLDIGNTSVEALIQGIMTAVYYLIGGYFVCTQSMSMGSVLAFISYSGNVTGPISMLMNIKMIIAQIRPSFERLEKFLALDTEAYSGAAGPDEINTLELTDVSFSYGDRKLLEHACLHVHKGERIAIVGENGSGKSTLLNLLLRLNEPNHGQILLDGKNIHSLNLREYRQLFSVVSQFPYLFQDTIRENLDSTGDYTDEEIIRLFSAMGMEDLYHHFPNGLDTVIGVDSANLSGGEKQKLAFLRAVLRKSPILIFDESTSNYDKESEEWFFTKGLELFRDRIVIIVIHHSQFLEKCDRIYRIENCTLVLQEQRQTVTRTK